MMTTSVSMRPRIAHWIGTVKVVECKRLAGNGRFARASSGQILLCPLNVRFALDNGPNADIAGGAGGSVCTGVLVAVPVASAIGAVVRFALNRYAT